MLVLIEITSKFLLQLNSNRRYILLLTYEKQILSKKTDRKDNYWRSYLLFFLYGCLRGGGKKVCEEG